ncbi:hypothetical protein TNCV_2339081 [Trichonephila clavipes]|nr:hypothetical protein TNCV_2339081 [Trichonephila clavipes]
MLIEPANSQTGLVRGTILLPENSITVRITEQHKRMEVITQKIYVSNCIEEVLYTPISVISCPGKTFNTKASIEHRSTAPETHTVKGELRSSFTDCTTGTVTQLGGNLSSCLASLATYNTPRPSLTTSYQNYLSFAIFPIASILAITHVYS